MTFIIYQLLIPQTLPDIIWHIISDYSIPQTIRVQNIASPSDCCLPCVCSAGAWGNNAMNDSDFVKMIQSLILTHRPWVQVHATVPLTNSESICIISVEPIPYVLYTGGKLVIRATFWKTGVVDNFVSIPRSLSTSSHLWPSSSPFSVLGQGFTSISFSGWINTQHSLSSKP